MHDTSLDNIPGLVNLLVRMGQTTQDTPVRECLAIRDEWRRIFKALPEDTEQDRLDSQALKNRIYKTLAFNRYSKIISEFQPPQNRSIWV